jgi:uncharacterized membrane protein YidH (DUF202 family)
MPFGRLLIVLGLILLVAGLLLTYTNVFSILRLGKLPGDISIKRENFSFYFPITTCIFVSAVLTLIFYILRR